MTDHGVIRSDRVFNAMLATDRGIYSRDHPYADSPQSIGEFHSSAGMLVWIYEKKKKKHYSLTLCVCVCVCACVFYKGYKATISAPHMVGQTITSEIGATVIFNILKLMICCVACTCSWGPQWQLNRRCFSLGCGFRKWISHCVLCQNGECCVFQHFMHIFYIYIIYFFSHFFELSKKYNASYMIIGVWDESTRYTSIYIYIYIYIYKLLFNFLFIK